MEAIKHAIEHYKKRVKSLDCKIWEEEILKLLEAIAIPKYIKVNSLYSIVPS